MYCISFMLHKPNCPIMKHVNFTTVVNIPSQSTRCSASVKEIKKKKKLLKIVNEITLFLGGQRYAVPLKCLF